MTLRSGPPESVGMAADRIDREVQLVRGWVEKVGVRTVDPGTGLAPHPRDAMFPPNSITKVLTVTALMTLVEKGPVGLNRPVFS